MLPVSHVDTLMHPQKIGRPVEASFGQCVIEFGSTACLSLLGFYEMRDQMVVHAVRIKNNEYRWLVALHRNIQVNPRRPFDIRFSLFFGSCLPRIDSP